MAETLPERYGHTMKANQSIKRAAALGLSALVLSSVMLCSVACTRDDHKNPGDTTAGGTQATTTPATDKNDGSGSGSDKPLDPDAGTVNPDGEAGDPPTGTTNDGTTGSEKGHSMLPRFMQ